MFWDGRLRGRADHRLLIEWAAILLGHCSLGVSRCIHHREFFYILALRLKDQFSRILNKTSSEINLTLVAWIEIKTCSYAVGFSLLCINIILGASVSRS